MKSKDKEVDLHAVISNNNKSKPIKKLIILLVIIILALIGYYTYSRIQAQEQSGPNYVTEPIKKSNISLTITTTGTLEPTNQVTLGSELSGTTLEVYVDSNDKVEKGQALAKLDTTKFAQAADSSRAALRSAKASVSQAKATLKEVQAKLDRYQELHQLSGGKTPAKADMDSAIAAVERAKADQESTEAKVSEAEANLITKESDLSKTIIRSPVDGVVLTRSIEEGQTVAAQFQAPELFIIAEDLSKMELLVSVAEADIGRLLAEQTASFTVDAWPNRTYHAAVTKVSYGSTITDNVVTYETELDVSNTDLSLRPGMTATAEIKVAEVKNVLVVPNAALRFSPQAAKAAGEKGEKKTESKSLVSSLTPSRPGRGGGGGRSGGGSRSGTRAGGAQKASNGQDGVQEIWVLRDGEAVSIKVTTGLTDGRHTEVSGPDVSENMEVIISASPAKS